MKKDQATVGRPAGKKIPALGPRELGFLREFKRRLLSNYPDRIKQVTLFGSRAMGSARETSDYDVFIMVDRKERRITDEIFDLAYEIYSASNLAVDISPVIMSEEYFQNRLTQERRIATDIEREGVPL